MRQHRRFLYRRRETLYSESLNDYRFVLLSKQKAIPHDVSDPRFDSYSDSNPYHSPFVRTNLLINS